MGGDGGRPVLLIAVLSPLTWCYGFLFRSSFSRILFIDTGRAIRFLSHLRGLVSDQPLLLSHRVLYADVPGSFFDTHEEAALRVNDALMDDLKDSLYTRLACSFFQHPRLTLAIRKELFNRYTYPRVKPYVILSYLRKHHPEITFLPVDHQEVMKHFSPPLIVRSGVTVPHWYMQLSRFTRRVLSVILLIALPFLLTGLGIKIAGRGVILRTPEACRYPYGFDIQRIGLKRDRGLSDTGEYFLYDDRDFHPSRILHVVRDHLEDDAARASLVDRGCPYVEVDTLKPPAGFLCRRVAGDMVVRSLGRTILLLGRVSVDSATLVPCLAVMKMTVEAEIQAIHVRTGVFIARDEYSPFHILRTLIAEQNGDATLGFQWADYFIRTDPMNCLYFTRYAIWGEFYRRHHGKALTYCDTAVIGGGVYGTDIMYRLRQEGYIPDEYRDRKQRYRIVAILGSTYSEETNLTKEHTLTFYRDALEFAHRYPDVWCVLKPKTGELDRELGELVRMYPRASIERVMWTYRFLLVPDLVICIGASTIGVESLIAGIRVLYYEVSGNPRDLYAHYSPYLVAFSHEEFDRNVHRVLGENRYLDPELLEKIRHDHGYRFDGCVVDRLKAECRDLLEHPAGRGDPEQRATGIHGE